MNPDYIKETLDELNIDDRLKIMMISYFVGKSKIDNLSEKDFQTQLRTLCNSVKNIEFLDYPNAAVTLERDASILSINKNAFERQKSEDVMALIFSKFEEALDTTDYSQEARRGIIADRGETRHAYYFLKGIEVAQSLKLPISKEQLAAAELIKMGYVNNEEGLFEHEKKERIYLDVRTEFDEKVNNMVTTGRFDIKRLAPVFNFVNSEMMDRKYERNEDITTPDNQEYISRVISLAKNFDDYEESISKRIIDKLQEMTGLAIEDIASAPIEQEALDNPLKKAIEEQVSVQSEDLTDEYIEKRVESMLDRKPNWDDRIKHIVLPFFKRSAILYKWSTDQFNERLNQVDLEVKEIKFVKLGEEEMGSTAEDHINFNADAYLDKKGEIKHLPVLTLFHELGHRTDETRREGVAFREQAGVALVGKFYEWTNTVFERVAGVGKLYRDKYGIFADDASYTDVQHAGSMISAAMGIPEVEFARLKDAGKEAIEKFFQEKCPVITAQTKGSMLDKINVLFSEIEYPDIFDGKTRRKNQEAFNELYELSISLMKERIDSELTSGEIENDEEYKIKQSYFLKKLNKNYEKTSKQFGKRFKKDPIIHDIGACNDDISRENMKNVGGSFVEEIEALNKAFHQDLVVPKKVTSESFDSRVSVQLDGKYIPSQDSSRGESVHKESKELSEK